MCARFRFEEIVNKSKVEYHAGGSTQNSVKIAQVGLIKKYYNLYKLNWNSAKIAALVLCSSQRYLEDNGVDVLTLSGWSRSLIRWPRSSAASVRITSARFSSRKRLKLMSMLIITNRARNPRVHVRPASPETTGENRTWHLRGPSLTRTLKPLRVCLDLWSQTWRQQTATIKKNISIWRKTGVWWRKLKFTTSP